MAPHSVRVVIRFGSIAVLGLVLVACGRSRSARQTTPVDRASASQYITAQDIEESGAATAWEALRLLAPHLRADERQGRPVRLQRRGPSSILLSDPPLVFVDGIRMADFRDLALLPARQVESITILTLGEGATYYGTNAAGGVIVIKTKHS